jgi:predicted GIY-YIG superfamily endonuclease
LTEVIFIRGKKSFLRFIRNKNFVIVVSWIFLFIVYKNTSMSEREIKEEFKGQTVEMEKKKEEEQNYEKYSGISIIYVLELQGDDDGSFWYIGRSKNLTQRLEFHKQGNSAYFVGRHPMKRVDKIFAYQNNEQADLFDEEACFFRYAKRYGISRCRGGRFTEIILKHEDQKTIEEMINCPDDDECYLCHEHGHFFKNCPFIKCNGCHELGHIHRECPSVICWRCGGCHFKIDCSS